MSPLVALLIITVVAFALPLMAFAFGRRVAVTATVPLCLVLANALGGTFVEVWGVQANYSVPIFSATFLASSILNEHYGRQAARHAVYAGIAGQLFAVAFISLILQAPFDPKLKESIEAVFHYLPRLVGASIVAYVVGQVLDIWVYAELKAKSGSFMWWRNIFATTLGQFFDSFIVVFLGFYGEPPYTDGWLTFKLVLSVWAFKIVVSAVDTPYLYLSVLLTRMRPRAIWELNK